MALACSVAPWARDWELLESCSASPEMRRSALAICPMAVDRFSVRRLMEPSMDWKSPIKDVEVVTLKLPSDICPIMRLISVT